MSAVTGGAGSCDVVDGERLIKRRQQDAPFRTGGILPSSLYLIEMSSAEHEGDEEEGGTDRANATENLTLDITEVEEEADLLTEEEREKIYFSISFPSLHLRECADVAEGPFVYAARREEKRLFCEVR